MTLSFSSLSGGTSFTVITSTGGSKTATLSKTFPAGTYLIESMAADTNLEVYLGASDGTQVGSCVAGAKSITASAAFLYVTTVNADTNDAVTFTLKSAATLATKTDAVWAPPTITDITPSGLPNINDTTTITGTNFATNVEVKFRKSDDSTLVTPKSTVRGSATSIIAGRPDSFAVGDAPYDVIVTNPSTNLSASSLNAITAGAVPVWVTSSTLNEATLDTAFSQTIQATDADGGSSITYAIVSGALQTGLSLNSSTGVITGTPTGSAGSTTITISATDSGGNAVNRTFTQVIAAGGITIDYLVIGGGGSAGIAEGGGGGAGGLRSTVGTTGGGGSLENSLSLNNNAFYTVVVGAGGGRTGVNTHANGLQGSSSSFSGTGISTITSLGGGLGAGDLETPSVGGNGGSGGGASVGSGTSPDSLGGTAGTGQNGQGYNGGRGYYRNSPFNLYGGGGGGAGGNGSNASSGSGGNGGAGVSISAWSTPTSTGISNFYAGGGGGGAYSNGSTAGTGGSGGGGNGGAGITASGTSGTANTGGGGGGAGGAGPWGIGGAGGSGLVVLRYAGSQKATGGTVVESGGYTYHTFRSSGTFATMVTTAKASGGTITRDSNFIYHTFTSSGAFVPNQTISNASALVVAGGGAGGQDSGGGGGAGGVIGTNSLTFNNSTNYTITVGNGGTGATYYSSQTSGGNSEISGSGFSTITATGGGRGGGLGSGYAAANGGSGGGGSGGGSGVAGTGIGGQGNNGGTGDPSGPNYPAGGGGGAGGAGGNAVRSNGNGNGGVGTSSFSAWGSATGTGELVSGTYYYGGGGGGTNGMNGTQGIGGDGGGGDGAQGTVVRVGDGMPNTGGGGGGGTSNANYGGNGGSGVVIIRYPV